MTEHVKSLISVTLPLAVIRAYWRLVPGRVRSSLSDPPGTSASAWEAVSAGGGWRAFWHYALPRRSMHGGPFDWAHYR